MGFTTNCFIRKNTPELRENLKKIGYVCRGINIENYPHIETKIDVLNKNHEYGAYYGCNNGEKNETIDGVSISVLIEGIDCGKNEELFLAIAALRNDSDIHQWFTDGEKWVISDIHTLIELKEYFEEIKFDYSKTHKATVKELIEYFK